jgi:hypothetical protein
VVPAAHELTRKTSIEPSKAQKGKQSNNSKNNYLIRLRVFQACENARDSLCAEILGSFWKSQRLKSP